MPKLQKLLMLFTDTWTILLGNLNFAIKVDKLNLLFQNHTKNNPGGSSEFPQSKFEANRSRGSWVMIGKTNKQPDRQSNRKYNFIYIDIQYIIKYTPYTLYSLYHS